MKTLIQFIAFAVVVIKIGYSQDYVKMPVTNAIWSEYYLIYNGINPEIYPYYVLTNGDTLIDNLTYHKIVRSNDTVIDFSMDTYTGCFREDTNKAVWFLPRDSINEVLLYDFSKQVGDTVIIPATQLWKYETLYLIIGEIDSLEIQGNFRKVFHFTEWLTNELYWIEGIGSNMGFLFSFYSYGIGEGPELNCLTLEDTLIYYNPDSWLNDCFVFTGVEDQNILKPEFRIFPNPATSFITLTTPQGEPALEAVICNHLGQKVLTAKPVNNTMDVSGLKAGMYLIEISTKDRTERTKFVKN
jgi:hypothetical protein